MKRGTEQMFFQRRHADGQQVYETVLNINDHQENANQNHTCQNGCYQKENKKCCRGYGEKRIFVHCWQKVNSCSYYGNQYRGPSKN